MAEYGALLIERLSLDLNSRFGRGFSKRNVEQMRHFYLVCSIAQTLSAQSSESPILQTASENPSGSFRGRNLQKVLAAECKTTLSNEKTLAVELDTNRLLE